MAKVKEVHLLSLVYIWHLAYETLGIQCEKQLIVDPGSEQLMRNSRFLTRLTGRDFDILKKEFPNDFETFKVQEHIGEEEIGRILKSTIGSKTSDSGFFKELMIHYREVIANAFDHSAATSEVIAVARYADDSSQLEFCVFDRGRGISGSFLTNPLLRKEFLRLKDDEIIERAIQSGISCNPRHAPHPDRDLGNSGIGLYYLSQCCRLHPSSRLIVVSGCGVLYVEGGRIRTSSLKFPVLGCAVYVKTDVFQDLSPDYKNLIQEYIKSI